ncbi:MAG TPA: hypothetical protein VGC91_07960 [Pyrinomonadaceae bacterium]|jgi:hypothetical protein
MEFSSLEVDRDEARKRVEAFTSRQRKNLTEMDRALYRGYKALAEGLAVIDVNEAIRRGGQFPDNHCPKLALARADLETIFFEHTMTYASVPQGEMEGRFKAWERPSADSSEIYKALLESNYDKQLGSHQASINQGLFIELAPGVIEKPDEKAIGQRRWFKATYASPVPLIPFHLRPKDDLSKYFILWDVAEWREVYYPPRAPHDPLLLERIAHPIYVVVAQWDLTELEQRILESFRRRS